MPFQDPDVPQDFLMWEATSRDTIDFKKIYVDMTGDLVTGLMLSQIVFWYLPDKHGQSKLRIERDGHWWLAKARHEWWEECRISLEQVKRATKLLLDMDLIITERFKFSGAPTTHMRINWSVFMARWNEIMAASYQDPIQWSESHQSNGVKATNPKKGKPPIKQGKERRTITETTNRDNKTKKTAKTTTPTTPAEAEGPNEDALGVVGVAFSNEGLDVYSFLTKKCGVWDKKAQQLASQEHLSLEQTAHWWAVLKSDESIRNRAAVLVHHLESGENPPDFVDSRQRLRFEQYLLEYMPDDDFEDEKSEE